MKLNNTKRVALALCGALVLTACNKDVQQEGGFTGQRIVVTAQTEGDNETRTTLNGLSTQWVAGDKIGVFSSQAGASNLSLLAATGGAATSNFNGDMYWGTGGHDFYAYYPHVSGTFDHTAVPISLPAEQIQSAGSNSDHLASLDFMVAQPLTGVELGGNVQFQFMHKFTMLEFHVLGTGIISKIKFEVPEYDLWFTNGTTNLSTGNDSYSSDQSGSSVTLTLGSPATLTENKATTPALYMMICPFPAGVTSKEVNVIATIDDVEKTFTATVPRFESGNKYILNVTVKEEITVTEVSLNKSAISLVVGETETLVATIAPNNATNQNVSWSSSADGVASVDSNGTITAVSPGTATIIVATADGGKTAFCVVTVNNAVIPESIDIDGIIWATRNVGSSGTFVTNPWDYGNYYAFAEAQNVCPSGWRIPTFEDISRLADAEKSWTTVSGVRGMQYGSNGNTIFLPAAGCRYSNGNYTSVGDVGYYWSSAYGYCLYFYSGVSRTWDITPSYSLTVRCVKTSSESEAGIVELSSVGIMVHTTDISTSPLTWESANNLCENSTLGGYTDWRLPSISELTTIYTEKNTIGSFNSSLYWSSTSYVINDYYYTISFSSGSQSPTLNYYQNYARCVRTLNPVTSVSLNKSTTTIMAGNTEILSTTILPANASNKEVTWSSSNSSVATVDQTGKVTGITPGTATITVTTADGNKTATCAITVEAYYIELSIPGLMVHTADISTKTLTWESANNLCENSILGGYTDWRLPSISELITIYTEKNTIGNFNTSSYYWSSTALNSASYYTISFNSGSQYTTLYYHDCYARCVRSMNPVTSVSLNKNTTTIMVGGTETLSVTILPANATNKDVTWSSSDTSVASVNNGTVTAISGGTATITSSTFDGNKTASCVVTVNAMPTLSTQAVTGINVTSGIGSATFKGTILTVGSPEYTERGFVYGTASTPTIDNNKIISSGSGTGIYNESVSGLTNGQVYYVRAYATSTLGTTYGEQVYFKAEQQPFVELTAHGIAVSRTNLNLYDQMISGTLASTNCQNLSLGGYTDWRLPTPTELSAIYANKSLFVDLYDRAGSIYTVGGNTAYIYDCYWSYNYTVFSFHSGIIVGSMNSSLSYKVEDTNKIIAMSARCVRTL